MCKSVLTHKAEQNKTASGIGVGRRRRIIA